MKHTKQLLTVLLMTLLCAVLVLAVSAEGDLTIVDSGNCGEWNQSTQDYADNVKWTLDSEGTLTISGEGAIEKSFHNNQSIKKAVIKKGVTRIGFNAFEGCTGLTSVTIPDSVTDIFPDAFRGCSALVSISVGNNITNISDSSFCETAYFNDDNNWSDGVLYLGPYLIKADESLHGEYTIREGTTLIASFAFVSCDNLTSVTFPRSLTYICDFAFYYCNNLTSITLPNGIKYLGGKRILVMSKLRKHFYSKKCYSN